MKIAAEPSFVAQGSVLLYGYAFDKGADISWNWGFIPKKAINEVITSPLEKLFKSEAIRKARDGAFERIRKCTISKF